MARPPALVGTLSLYPLPNSTWERRPYFTSGDTSSSRAVVFIGGLHSGMLDAPFLVPLSNALGAAGWKLVQIHWSSAYDGFGTGSLDRDVDEMAALIAHLKRREGVEMVVIAGHSTGSQDVLHYLTRSRDTAQGGGGGGGTEGEQQMSSTVEDEGTVKGGIMISPASDREFFEKGRDPMWVAQLAIAERLIAEGRGSEILGEEMTKAFGARVTASRLHSLIGVGGNDDYFSSDIPDAPDGSKHVHPLSTSFGRLHVPVRALWMGNDYCGTLADQRPLLRRWEAAASNNKLSWTVIEGASHSVDEESAQEMLCADITSWLAEHFGQ